MSNPKNSKKIFRIIIVIAVLAIVVVGAYSIHSVSKKLKTQTASMTQTNALATQAVEKSDINSVVSTTGTVQTEKEYTVSVTANQKISKVLVEVGDTVQQDQVLIKYDFETSKKNLDKLLADAKISLETAQLNLKSLNLPATQTELANLENTVVSSEKSIYQAQVELDSNTKKINTTNKDIETARTNMDNSKNLYDIGALSKTDYDKTVTEYDNKLSALDDLETSKKSCEYNISIAQYQLDKAKKDLSRAKNSTKDEADQIKYKQQLLQLDSCNLRIKDLESQMADLKDVSTSPATGVVISKSVEDGDTAAESKELLKVADVTKLIVSTTVSEYDAAKIALGQTVTMQSDGIKDKTYTGKITFIDPVAKKTNSDTLVNIKVSIDNSDAQLKPGFTIDLDILTSSAKNTLCVPTAAILVDKDHNKYVFTLSDDNKLSKKIIKTGVAGDIKVEVKEGLAEGDKVVASPNDTMQDGQSIDPKTGLAVPETTAAGAKNGSGKTSSAESSTKAE
jgi:RND family efflux transporter MFP subunit